MESKLSLAIIRRFYSSNVGVILVEGIPQEEYPFIIRKVQDYFSRLEKPLSKDFFECI